MLPPSTKPYFIRALYEWCVDQNYTPHLLVEVDEQCRVPLQFVKDGTIILNIGPMATKNLTIDNDWIQFTARFSGVSELVAVPMVRVGALYTRETQEGMGFEVSSLSEEELNVLYNKLEDEKKDLVSAHADEQEKQGASLNSAALSKSDKDKMKQEARARFRLVED